MILVEMVEMIQCYTRPYIPLQFYSYKFLVFCQNCHNSNEYGFIALITSNDSMALACKTDW